jgi:signal transduction histidine kinase/CheY-like chemotaxis protein
LLTQSQSLAEELQSRQQELQQTNQELQEKARLLAHQNQEVERKNAEVEQARQALEEKAEQLALTSKYKSEFLANMSHELRTPLNSLLILSDQLCKNQEGNLTGRQVEFSKTIHSSGNDLLMLINDILDLSKIESGTVAVDVGEVRIDDLQRSIERSFRHFAESKHLEFGIQIEQPLPKSLVTDVKRLQQIIKNLLSNAFKFTHQGSVSFKVATAASGWNADNEELGHAAQVIAFSVSDSGIGISPDKQQIIFEAFQQADGSTSRKYGGTGLGLAISRELARLLGGEIKLVSQPGVGSTFTLYLPQSYNPVRTARQPRTAAGGVAKGAAAAPSGVEPAVASASVRRGALTGMAVLDDEYTKRYEPESENFANVAGDDRGAIASGDRVLLIVENDLAFAEVLLDAARLAGFKGIVSNTGAGALTMAREFHPSAITLDIFLPDMQGWRILDRMKADTAMRHMPICVVSTDDARERAVKSGAIGFIAKPLQSKDAVDSAVAELMRYCERPSRKLVVALPPSPMRSDLLAALDGDVQAILAEDGDSIRAALTDADCLVIDTAIGDVGPEDIVDAMASRGGVRQLPVVLCPSAEANGSEVWQQPHLGFAVQRADSLLAMLAHASYLLHRSPALMSEREREAIETIHGANGALQGKKALIVDDDMRNIFALATVLDGEGMEIVSAETGREAIRLVHSDPTIDIVLMDIMMPVMDGIATMQEIRKLPRGRELPMVAVTAKAMKGDRQKCIEAGAWDYISKPVDPTHLLAVLRGWLCR